MFLPMEHPNRCLLVKMSQTSYLPPHSQMKSQQGLNKLLLTFLDDAIDKNRLAIWSTRANLSRVLAHLK